MQRIRAAATELSKGLTRIVISPDVSAVEVRSA
jgi:hypothetical protein